MSSLLPALRKRAASLVGAGAVLVLGILTLPREMPAVDRARYEQAFAFDRTELAPEIAGLTRDLKVRAVHPSLDRISAWISTLGASVALGDLDGDGLSNDYCLVDTRANAVIAAPVPGTGDRFPPFVLERWDEGPIAPSGVQFGDFNEDGQTDLLVQYWGRPPRAHLRQTNTTAITPDQFVISDLGLPQPGWHTAESNPAARWYTNALVQADVDGDGHLDLVIGNYFQDGAAILDGQGTEPQSMHAGKAKAFNGGTKHFLLWKSATTGDTPAVTYTDAESNLPPELAHGWTLALGAVDLDGDLLPELYLGNDFGPDQLLHNRSTPGKLVFTPLHGKRDWNTPKSCVLGADPFKGMAVDFGDVNGD
ncbi:MAG: VCBS repeat-containing protein, partial [Planctomycetota bacterium]|nr:VCBS repeat-containing protein [Planctomycetota bacterium]